MIKKGSRQAGGSALTGDWQPMEAAPQLAPEPLIAPAKEAQQSTTRSAVLLQTKQAHETFGASSKSVHTLC